MPDDFESFTAKAGGSAPDAAAPDDFEKFAKGSAPAGPLRVASAQDVAPEAAAQAVSLASKTGAPVDSVLQTPAPYKAQVDADATDKLTLDAPKTAGWAAQAPQNYHVVKDDLQNATAHEAAVKDWSLMRSLNDSIMVGVNQFNTSLFNAPSALYNLAAYPQNAIAKLSGRPDLEVRSPEALRMDSVQKFYGDQVKAYQASSPETTGDPLEDGKHFAAHLVSSFPLIAGGLATTFLGGSAAGLGFFGATAASSADKEALDAGVDPVAQAQHAALSGVVNAGISNLSFGAVGLFQGAVGKVAQQYGKQTAIEFAKATMGTLAKAAGSMAADMPILRLATDTSEYLNGVNPDAFKDLFHQMVTESVMGGVTGALMHGPASLAAGIHAAKATADANHTQAAYDAIGKLASESKLRALSPESHEALHEAVNPGADLFIPLEAVEKHFQSVDESPGMAAVKLGLATEYSDAKDNGTDMRVKQSKWTAKTIDTDVYAAARDDIKASPDDLTVNQAKELEVRNKAIMDESMKPAAEGSKEADFGAEMGKQLKAVGYTDDVIKSMVDATNGVLNLSKRSGRDLISEMPLSVSRTEGPEGLSDKVRGFLKKTLGIEGQDETHNQDVQNNRTGLESGMTPEQVMRDRYFNESASKASWKLMDTFMERQKAESKEALEGYAKSSEDYHQYLQDFLSGKGKDLIRDHYEKEFVLPDGTTQVVRFEKEQANETANGQNREPGLQNRDGKDQVRGAEADSKASGLRSFVDRVKRQFGLGDESSAADAGRDDAGRAAREVPAPSGIEDASRLPGYPDTNIGPHPGVAANAREYHEAAGISFRRQAEWVRVDDDRAKRLADAYEEMKHDPEDPKVKAAYKALAKETVAQFRQIEKLGLKFEKIPEGAPDPYPEGPRQAIEDVHQNGHLWYFPSVSGFGTETKISDNPLLEPSGVKLNGEELPVNDVFRIVHDIYGHVKEGNSFGARGEENAWQSHVRMYSPEAALAMTSETRGQNSWVNFHPKSEANRTAPGTVYADQKTGLMPDWTATEGLAPDQTAQTVRQQSSLGFYSELERTIESKLPASAPVSQVEGLLKGVKAEERKWSGIDDFLKGKDKVSKPELLEFLRANQLNIQEVTKGAETDRPEFERRVQEAIDKEVDDQMEHLYEQDGLQHTFVEKGDDGQWHVYGESADPDDVYETEAKAQARADRYNDSSESEARIDILNEIDEDRIRNDVAEEMDSEGGGPRYAEHVLPGGENYREVLLTLPSTDAEYKELSKTNYSDMSPEQRNRWEQLDAKNANTPSFGSGHFDERNILAHVRLDDRTDSEGKRVLFLEEVQSDWHQAGRKRGYKGEVPDHEKAINDFNAELSRLAGDIDAKKPGAREKYNEVMAKRDALADEYIKNRDAVPDAPFKKTWHEFALKRVIRMAAENGYDKVGWTTGDQQAERYDLSKQIQSLHYQKNEDGTFKLSYQKDHRGTMIGESIPAEKLEDYIGKDVAKKIVAGEGNDTNMQGGKNGEPNVYKELSGLDLKVGGEGMRGFYDDILPAYARKLGKKFGAEVGTSDVPVAGHNLAKEANGHGYIALSGESEFPGMDKFFILGRGGYREVSREVALSNINGTSVYGLPRVEPTTIHSMEMTPALKQAAMEGFSLFQDGDKGQIRYGADKKFNIELLRHADLSTFLHEMGHYYLEVMHEIASPESAPADLKQDLGVIRDWLGNTGEKFTDAQHEKFARGFETYLMEGKAPSAELRPAFAKYRAWLLSIYKSLGSLNAPLTDQVRGVFDRILASQEQIDQVSKEQSFEGLDPEALLKLGISPGKIEEYAKATAEAREFSRAKLEHKLLGDIRREQTSWWKSEKAKATADAEKLVDAQPEYAALKHLQGNEPFVRFNEKLGQDESFGKVRLDKKAVAAQYGEDVLKALPRGVTTAEGGMHPDVAAGLFGFNDGAAMLKGISEATPRKEMVSQLADHQMKEQHGDMVLENKVPKEALDALHTDKHLAVMRTELEFLATKKLGTLKDMAKTITKTVPKSSYFTDRAVKAIASKTVRSILPAEYQRAEAKNGAKAIDALLKGDIDGAFNAKYAQVMNHELYKAASDAREAVDKGVKYLNRFDKDAVRGRMTGSYVEQIDALLDRFDLRKSISGKAIDRNKQALADFAAKISGQGYEPQIPLYFQNEQNRTHYKDMPYENFQGLVDSVKSIEYIGKQQKMAVLNGQAVELSRVVDLLNAKLDERGVKFTKEDLVQPPTREVDGIWKAVSHWFGVKARLVDADLKPAEFKFNKYDMHELDGPFRDALLDPLLKANYEKVALTKSVSDKAAEVGKALGKDWQASLYDLVPNDKLNDPDLGGTMKITRAKMLGIARHIGNESNLTKLILGYGWTAPDVREFLNKNMTDKDWQATQAHWDAFEPLWTKSEAMIRRLGGVPPTKIEAEGFTTPQGREMRGGYSPIDYDPLRSKLAASKGEFSLEPGDEVGKQQVYKATTTRNGSLNERSGYTDRVSLDFHSSEARIRDTIHDLAYREALINSAKVVGDEGFREKFLGAYGREEYQALNTWLTGIRDQNSIDPRTRNFDKAMQYTRQGIVITGIGYRLSTVFKHAGSAALKSLGYLGNAEGAKYFGARVARMASGHMSEDIAGAQEKFDEIRTRMLQMDRDYKEGTGSMYKDETVMEKNNRFGHHMVAWSDALSAVPTAWAAYDLAKTSGVPKSMGGSGEPMTETEARAYANSVVRQAHGTALEVTRSNFLQARGAKGLFGALYGFMNNTYGQMGDMLDKSISGGKFQNKPAVAARLFATLIVPAVWASYLSKGAPKEDENAGIWGLKALAGEVAGTMPFVRDAAALLEYGHGGTIAPIQAMTDAIFSVRDAWKESQGEQTQLIQELSNTVGEWGHIAGMGQLGHILQYIHGVETGQHNPESGAQAVKEAVIGGAR